MRPALKSGCGSEACWDLILQLSFEDLSWKASQLLTLSISVTIKITEEPLLVVYSLKRYF